MSEATLRSFWDWFRVAAPRLAAAADGSEPVVGDLDQRLGQLGVAWELGPVPGAPDHHSLAISFDGDLAILATARQVVGAAPEIPGWRVVLGKPARQWDWQFTLPTDGAGSVEFQASEWPCAVTMKRDGRFIVRIYMGRLSAEQDRLAEWAAEIAVQGAIGEMAFATRVSELIIASRQEVERAPGAHCLLPDLATIVNAEVPGPG